MIGNGSVKSGSHVSNMKDAEADEHISSREKFQIVNIDKDKAPSAKSECVSTVSTQDACVSTEDDDFEDIEDIEEPEDEKTAFTFPGEKCMHMVTEFADDCFDTGLKWIFRKYSPIIPTLSIYNETLFVILRVDSLARKLFPLTFLLLQVTYWTAYLYIL